MTTPLNRRTFLGHSLALPAAFATAGLGLGAAEEAAGKAPLRIGLVSAGSYGASYGPNPQPRKQGSNHGTAFATTFNGFNEEKAKAFEGTFVRASKRIEGARVVKIWDPIRSAAEAVADVCDIPTVTDSYEDCAKDVDMVLIVDDGSGAQWKYAASSLRAGVPTFCDKPLAMTVKDAKEVAAIVKETGTKFMSASSLRFIPDIVKLKEDVKKIGPVRICTLNGPGDLVYYGIHALSMAYAVFGPGIFLVENIGTSQGNILNCKHKDDLTIMAFVTARDYAKMNFSIDVFGENGLLRVEPNLKDLYTYLLENFLDYVLHDRVSVPLEEEIELIAALEAGEISLKEKRIVELKELL